MNPTGTEVVLHNVLVNQSCTNFTQVAPNKRSLNFKSLMDHCGEIMQRNISKLQSLLLHCLVGGDDKKIVWQQVPTIFDESSFLWMEYPLAVGGRCVFQP